MSRNPDKRLLQEEDNIQKQINEYIDQRKSFVFDAAAGSGKTYALVATVNHIIGNYEHDLKQLNQKILVITYTNSAKDEVVERVGKSDNLEVGTIHNIFWAFVSEYKLELKEIHKEKVNGIILDIKDKLGESLNRYIEYIKLFGYPQDMNEYYNNANKKAKEFKEYLAKYNEIRKEEYSNAGNFKKNIRDVRYYLRYKGIDYSKYEVSYNDRLGYDRLHYLEISHDTVIEYIFKMFNKYANLRKVFSTMYPYVLVDEYQDTNEYIYQTLLNVKKDNEKFVVGLFGDKMQKLYENGISEYSADFIKVDKNYNRRSSNSIIKIASKISGREEKSIYYDNYEGEVRYYNNKETSDIIEELKHEWSIKNENKLQVLTLKNADLAKYLNFNNYYTIFKNSNEYKNANYKNLNTEILPSKLEDLGVIQQIIFNITNLFAKLTNDYLFLSDLKVNYNQINQESFNKLKKIILTISLHDGLSILDFLDKLSASEFMKNSHYRQMISEALNVDVTPTEEGKIIDLIKSEIYDHMSNFDNYEDTKFDIIGLLNTKISEVINWFNFINGNQKGEVIFGTAHSAKGKEYHNVLVILEDNFKVNDYFANALMMIKNKEQNKSDLALNLLYVVSTRAIRNLAVLYVGDKNNTAFSKLFEKL